MTSGAGGFAKVMIASSSLWAHGDITLRGGDSGVNANGDRRAARGAALIDGANSRIHQLGRVDVIGGSLGSAPSMADGISLYRAEWVVYPCPRAGIYFSAAGNNNTNGTSNDAQFELQFNSTFADCRGADAVRTYPEPVVDGSSNGSCAPFTCDINAQPGYTCPTPRPSPSASPSPSRSPHSRPHTPSAASKPRFSHQVVLAAIESLCLLSLW
jgi:hypothetical protein